MTTNNKVALLSTQEILGREVAVYGTFENPLFLAKDVAEWIEHSNPRVMIKTVDDDEKVVNNVYTLGGEQESWFLTGNGVYKILMQNYSSQTKHIRKDVKKILVTLKRKFMRNKANKLIESSLHSEIWKDIPGYDGFYQASNIGRIRGTNRSYIDKNGKKTRSPLRVLKAGCGKTSPYLAVNISIKNSARKLMVHRLVAMTFLEDWDQDLEVNHIDGNVYNNCIDNIEMCTRQDNYKHAILENLKMDYGQLSINSKLTDADANRIRQLNNIGVRQVDLASVYKVSKQTISNIVNLKSYRKCE